ncbi:hypothetical protein CR513_31235, partial [Mucuna pruriens]
MVAKALMIQSTKAIEVKLIQEKMRVPQNRKRSYHNKIRKDFEFKEGDHVSNFGVFSNQRIEERTCKGKFEVETSPKVLLSAIFGTRRVRLSSSKREPWKHHGLPC